MLAKLIKLANKLDSLGEHEFADELDTICREAAEMKFVDKRPEYERKSDKEVEDWEKTMLPRIQKELKLRPGETDPRRYLINEEGRVHEEDRSEPTPEERMPPLFPGKKSDISPEDLSEEDLPDKYLETRVENMEDFNDPDRDLLVELLESMPRKGYNPDAYADDEEKAHEEHEEHETEEHEEEEHESDALDGLWS